MNTIKKCPVCQSEKIFLCFDCIDNTVSRETFPVYKCEECTFLFTKTRQKGNLGEYYQSDEYISHLTPKGYLINYISLSENNPKTKGKFLGKETGVLLEFGSGTGELLAACKEKGWKCIGVEPEEKARRQAYKITN